MSDPNRRTISDPFIDGMAGEYAAQAASRIVGELATEQAARQESEMAGGSRVLSWMRDHAGGLVIGSAAVTAPLAAGLAEAPVAAASVKQNCVHVGLTGEHILGPPELLRAGHARQTTNLQVEFDPMPVLCHGLYKRMNKIQYEMFYKGRWENMAAPGEEAIYTENQGTDSSDPFTVAIGETGHAIGPNGFNGIWHGNKVRVAFTNKVTKGGKIVGEKDFTKPVKISTSN